MSNRIARTAAAIGAAAALVWHAAAGAALVERAVTVPLSAGQIGATTWSSGILPIAGATVAVGDTVRIDATFANGQALRWQDIGASVEGATFFLSQVGGSPGTVETARGFRLTGVNGDLLVPSVVTTGASGGTGILGSTFNAGFDNWTDSAFTFTGFRFEFMVLAAPHFPIDVNAADTTLWGGAFSIVAIPEPGSAALLLAGLGLLAWSVHRRKARA